jgi:hypothetical protein
MSWASGSSRATRAALAAAYQRDADAEQRPNRDLCIAVKPRTHYNSATAAPTQRRPSRPTAGQRDEHDRAAEGHDADRQAGQHVDRASQTRGKRSARAGAIPALTRVWLLRLMSHHAFTVGATVAAHLAAIRSCAEARLTSAVDREGGCRPSGPGRVRCRRTAAAVALDSW